MSPFVSQTINVSVIIDGHCMVRHWPRRQTTSRPRWVERSISQQLLPGNYDVLMFYVTSDALPCTKPNPPVHMDNRGSQSPLCWYHVLVYDFHQNNIQPIRRWPPWYNTYVRRAVLTVLCINKQGYVWDRIARNYKTERKSLIMQHRPGVLTHITGKLIIQHWPGDACTLHIWSVHLKYLSMQQPRSRTFFSFNVEAFISTWILRHID